MPVAPVSHWGEADRHAHTVQFYGASAVLVEELSSFIGGALAAGDSAVVIATKANRDGLERQLHFRGFDTARAIAKGRYIALDAAETLAAFMRDGWPDAALFTEVVGGVLAQAAATASGKNARISAFGEMVALLWAEGNGEAAVRLEQLWNNLARMYRLSLHCAYPMSGFDRAEHGDLFLKICAEHSHVIPLDTWV